MWMIPSRGWGRVRPTLGCIPMSLNFPQPWDAIMHINTILRLAETPARPINRRWPRYMTLLGNSVEMSRQEENDPFIGNKRSKRSMRDRNQRLHQEGSGS